MAKQMINPEKIEEISIDNEAITEKRFKKLGFAVTRKDYQGPRRRPEFVVSDSRGPLLVCEVKTIFSGGFLHDRNAHVSTQDPDLANSGQFSYKIDLSKIDENLADAVSKYRALIADEPNLSDVPLVVALFFDFFADHLFDFYDAEMDRFPEVSGILRVESDHEIREIAQRMTTRELKDFIERKSMVGMPPNSKRFVLVQNECAKVKLPEHFIKACISS